MDTDAFFDFEHVDWVPERSAPEKFLSRWSEHDWARLLSIAGHRRLSPGACLTESGRDVDGLSIVASGSLTASTRDGRRRHVISQFDAGSLIGEMSFLDGKPASADVIADTDAEVFVITRERFDAWAIAHPDLGRDFLLEIGRVLATRLRHVMRI